ncbi:MAG: hypothetical protein HN741_11310 [Anaerolineae bacterium]|nr:hypothetical protein [Anaerolineae bacterium]
MKIRFYKLKNTLRTAGYSFLLGLSGLAYLPDHPIAIPAAFGSTLSILIIIHAFAGAKRTASVPVYAHWV